uniref:Unannotated protein n=1 Tax=freshwater metagenome TaxID=449393 RepID=A0A6J7NY11_9ZZZZ
MNDVVRLRRGHCCSNRGECRAVTWGNRAAAALDPHTGVTRLRRRRRRGVADFVARDHEPDGAGACRTIGGATTAASTPTRQVVDVARLVAARAHERLAIYDTRCSVSTAGRSGSTGAKGAAAATAAEPISEVGKPAGRVGPIAAGPTNGATRIAAEGAGTGPSASATNVRRVGINVRKTVSTGISRARCPTRSGRWRLNRAACDQAGCMDHPRRSGRHLTVSLAATLTACRRAVCCRVCSHDGRLSAVAAVAGPGRRGAVIPGPPRRSSTADGRRPGLRWRHGLVADPHLATTTATACAVEGVVRVVHAATATAATTDDEELHGGHVGRHGERVRRC